MHRNHCVQICYDLENHVFSRWTTASCLPSYHIQKCRGEKKKKGESFTHPSVTAIQRYYVLRIIDSIILEVFISFFRGAPFRLHCRIVNIAHLSRAPILPRAKKRSFQFCEAGSTVTIVSVTVVDVRHRQLLTAAVSVVYTVSSTAAANTLSSSLSSGTAAMSTALQTSYPTAVVATPVVITIVSPVASPIASPVSAPSGPSLVPIIAGAVGGGGGGLLLILGLGYLFYRRNALRKLTESQIHAAASPDAAGRNDNDNNRVSGSKELQAPKTGIASPTTNLSGIKLPPISSELKSSAKVAIVDTTEVPAGNSSSKVGLKHIMMSYC